MSMRLPPSPKGELAIQNVSDTALWVAAYRAIETNSPKPLFQDPLASVLIGERGRKMAEVLKDQDIMHWVMGVRTVAIDRLVEKAVELGVDTIVNLGAGLDTRPYRMKLPATLRWIEVDFSNIIDLKNEKLAGEKPVCRLERIALDLSKRTERKALFSKIASESRKVALITEGVIIYLEPSAAAELAEDLHAEPKFSYWIQDTHDEKNVRRIAKKRKEAMTKSPFLFFVPDWFAFFEAKGWKGLEIIPLTKQAEIIGRPFPVGFPWSILVHFIPKKLHYKSLRQTTYTLFERIS